MSRKLSLRALALCLGVPVSLALLAACAVGVQRKEFGEDFSDAGVGTDATTDRATPPVDGAPDAVPPGDGASPVDASVDQVAPPVDATVPDTAVPDAAVPDAGLCTAQIAVVGGDATTMYAAIHTAGAWTTQAVAGGSAQSGLALAAFDGGFTAAFRATGDALNTVTATGTVWSAPARVATASTRGTPALAVTGATAHLAFQDTSYLYAYSPWNGASWDAPSAIGAPQSFGAEPPSAVGVGGNVLVGFGGPSEGALNVQERVGASWGAALAVTGTAVCGTAGGGGVSRCGGAPALLATGGATADLLAVHIDKTTRLITASTRNATTKAFTVHGAIAAGTTSDEELFLARAGASRAVLVFRGQNTKGYAAIADLSVTPPRWSAPVALSSADLLSAPRVAAGVCGDDAVATFVVTGGAVKIVRLQGTAWVGEETVGTMGTARFASVATRP